MYKKVNLSDLTIKTKNLTLKKLNNETYVTKDLAERLAAFKNDEINGNVLSIEKDKELIGFIFISSYDEEKYPEFKKLEGVYLNFFIKETYRDKNYIQEAINNFVDYLFNVAKLDFVMSGYLETDKNLEKVNEMCGFRIYYKFKTTLSNGQEGKFVNTITMKKDYI